MSQKIYIPILTPIFIEMEDQPLHTDDTPFCDDLSCPCHRHMSLIDEMTTQVLCDGTLTVDEMNRLYRGQNI